MRIAVLSIVLLALLAAPAAAAPVEDSRHLWATVNACDTEARPDAIGIRASMPRHGRGAVAFMRFRVKYRDSQGRWRFVAEGADSGHVRLGVIRGPRLESGYDFTFRPRADGTPYQLRGHVTFTWRRRGRVVERTTKKTEAGHRSATGADPAGYSAATCWIS